MMWFFHHKIVSLFIIFCAVYWFGNPPGRFGFVRDGLVVYNHIPIALLDCYIAPDGSLFPEENLSNPTNVRYWFNEHFQSYRNKESALMPLFIGNGFSGTDKIAIDPYLLQQCRESRFEPHISSSQTAIEKYNTQILAGKKAAILLKIKKSNASRG